MISIIFLVTKSLFFPLFSFFKQLLSASPGRVFKLEASVVLQEDDVVVEPILMDSHHSFFLRFFFWGRIFVSPLFVL